MITVGDSSLTVTEVLKRIPVGLEPEDSARLFNSIAREWLERMLLSDIAAENVDDMEKIDRMVEQYRTRLIIESYRRKMRESNLKTPTEDSVKSYYQRNVADFTLQSPVVKGLFLKVDANSRHIADLRRWMATATPTAIDNLEKYGLDDAVKYSFFEDKWMDFATIAEQIPYRFYDSDAFVESTANFETTYAGMTYLLHISEYIKSGEQMPYEVAAPMIVEMLQSGQSDAFERKLMQQLYGEAMKEGRLKINPDYDLKLYQK